MKKAILCMGLFLLFSILCFPMAATLDVPQQDLTDNPIPSENTENTCICGRPYHRSDGKGYLKYDCIKCKKNYLLCECDCWCGSPTDIITPESGGVIKYCSSCQKPCPECICADKAVAILREQQIQDGILSPMGLAKPKTSVAIVFIMLFSFAATFLGIFCFNKKNLKSEKSERTEQKGGTLPEAENESQALQKADEGIEQSSPEKKKNVISYLVKWPIVGALPAITAFELLSSVFLRREEKEGLEILNPLSPMRLSAADLSALAQITGTYPNEMAAVILQEHVSDYENLERLSLIYKNENNEYVADDRSFLLTEAVFSPENILTLGKKSGQLFTICKKDGLWTVLASDEDGLYHLILGLNKNEITSLIKRVICNFEKCTNLPDGLDIGLTYNEWFVFLLSLLGNKEDFLIEDIKGQERIAFLQKGLRKMKLEKQASALFALMDNENDLTETINSLIQKGLFIKTENAFSLTEIALQWLTFDHVTDTVFLNNKGVDGTDYTMLFIQKTQGTVCLYDNEGTLRIMTAANIPWGMYLN